MKKTAKAAITSLAFTLVFSGITVLEKPSFSRNIGTQFPRETPTIRFTPVPRIPAKTIAQTPPSPPANLGQEVFQELSQCVITNIPDPEQPTVNALQTAAYQCFVKVIMLTPEGSIRPDANQRMIALLKTTGTTLPPSSSRGQAAIRLQPIEESRVFQLSATVGGFSGNFLLDTGASNSILDHQVAQQLGLTGTPVPSEILSYFVVGDDCSQIQATLLPLPPLAVASATVEGLNGMGLPKMAIPGNASGVLGLDFLKGFDVIINPQTLQLQLLPRSNPVANGIPLKGRLGVMTTQVKINGQGPFTFMLDTGADWMVVSQKLANQLTLDTNNSEEVSVTGFCGAEKGRKIKVSQVNLQEYQATELEAVILEGHILDLLGVDGIIGQNFLTRYQQHWRFGKPNELGFPEAGSLELVPLEN